MPTTDLSVHVAKRIRDHAFQIPQRAYRGILLYGFHVGFVPDRQAQKVGRGSEEIAFNDPSLLFDE